jgi:hypothetical protein
MSEKNEPASSYGYQVFDDRDFVEKQQKRAALGAQIALALRRPREQWDLDEFAALLKQARFALADLLEVVRTLTLDQQKIKAAALAEVMPQLTTQSRGFLFRCQACDKGHSTQQQVAACVAKKDARDARRKQQEEKARKAAQNEPKCKKCWDTKQLTLANGEKIVCQFCRDIGNN